MVTRFICFFMIAFSVSWFFVGCKNESTEEGRKFKKGAISLIRNTSFFSDWQDEYSFPVWFNDSLISVNQIKNITRKIYSPLDSLSEKIDFVKNVPSEIIVYFFKNDGSVSKVQHSFFYDDRKISEFIFSYPKSVNDNGYANPELDTIIQYGENVGKNGLFSEYFISENKTTYQVYLAKKSKSKLFVVPSENKWGPLLIDRKLKPKSSDKILIGSVFSPRKIYSVKNKVQESNVNLYNYRKGNLDKIIQKEFPFKKSRSFQYDKRGYCVGFIDSTFSEKAFLTRNKAIFTNNTLSSPTEIRHEQENGQGKINVIFYERFIYEFREK